MEAPQHVVVGYDGSSLSELAVHRALSMTENSAFGLIHVVSIVEDLGCDVRLPSGERMSRWAALDSLRHTLSRMTQASRRTHRRVQLLAHVRSGEVSQTLVDLAYRFHADQILVGAHGDGPDAAPVATVPRRILELSDIPVHIETALWASQRDEGFSPMRWAYVFGGSKLRRHHLQSFGQSERASA